MFHFGKQAVPDSGTRIGPAFRDIGPGFRDQNQSRIPGHTFVEIANQSMQEMLMRLRIWSHALFRLSYPGLLSRTRIADVPRHALASASHMPSLCPAAP